MNLHTEEWINTDCHARHGQRGITLENQYLELDKVMSHVRQAR